MSQEEVLTPKNVSQILQISVRAASQLGLEGKIPSFKIGTLRRFLRADVENYIEEQKLASKSA